MNTGIDVRLLSRSITGIGRYSLEMCKALYKQPGITLQLYSPGRISADISDLSNVSKKEKDWNNQLLRQLWAETYLPLWARQGKIDVFWGPAHRLPRWLPKKVARVVTIHDLVWKVMPESMQSSTRLLEKCYMPHAVRNADHIIAASFATATSVKNEFSIPEESVSVVHLASSRKPNETIANEQSEPFFLFVGTVEPRKNLIRLLKDYSQLSESVKNQAKLYIAGGKGWGDENVAAEIELLGIKQHVKMLGYVDEERLSQLYKNCLFLAMPSLYEGFGLPIVEAMSYGKPILTSNNSSMPEMAGDAGLLVDALDVNSIRCGLEQMIGSDDVRNSFAKNASYNANQFSWDKSATQLVNIFEKTISHRRGRFE